MGSGIVNTRPIQNALVRLIQSGKANPSSFIFDKNSRYDIEDAGDAYRDFAEKKIIKPYFRFERRRRDRSSSSERGRSKSPDEKKNGHGKRKRRYSRSNDSSSSSGEDRGRKHRGQRKSNGYQTF
jgi:hypothetical protein